MISKYNTNLDVQELCIWLLQHISSAIHGDCTSFLLFPPRSGIISKHITKLIQSRNCFPTDIEDLLGKWSTTFCKITVLVYVLWCQVMWTEMVNVRKLHIQIIRDTSENIQDFGNTYGAVIFELFMYHLRLIGVTTSLRGLTRKKKLKRIFEYKFISTDFNLAFLPTHLNTRFTFHNYLDLISPRVCPLQTTVKYSFFFSESFSKTKFWWFFLHSAWEMQRIL